MDAELDELIGRAARSLGKLPAANPRATARIMAAVRTRRRTSRQSVICARRVVTGTLAREIADKDRACVHDLLGDCLSIVRCDYEMLWCVIVQNLDAFVDRADEDRRRILDRGRGGCFTRQQFDLAINLGERFINNSFGGRDQNDLAVRAVFGLR